LIIIIILSLLLTPQVEELDAELSAPLSRKLCHSFRCLPLLLSVKHVTLSLSSWPQVEELDAELSELERQHHAADAAREELNRRQGRVKVGNTFSSFCYYHKSSKENT
jgi:hypothetical protein